MGQGQRSHGSGSKVTWVKPSLKVMIFADGLTSMSSCIFSYSNKFQRKSLVHVHDVSQLTLFYEIRNGLNMM